MEYLTAKEDGGKWGIAALMVNSYCSYGRIPSAIKKGDLWLVPTDAEKPKDGRLRKTSSDFFVELIKRLQIEIKYNEQATKTKSATHKCGHC